jgi:glycosyl-4,4'-diaponeurosporenoate acyltransferase
MRLPLVELSNATAVLIDCIVWAALSTVVGLVTHRADDVRFVREGWLLRIRPWERDGRVYEERLHIKRWKNHLPEAGHLFEGGFDKKHLRRADPLYLERFVIETRRAEWTHWVLLAAGPLFVLWNPWGIAVAMVIYAVVANGPCVIIQRYNRCRLGRVLDRSRRLEPERAPDPPRQLGDGHSRSGGWAVGRTNPEHR